MSRTASSEVTTAQWQQKRDQFVSKGVGNGNRGMAVKGEGALLYDLDGRRFIDFAGAIGTLNVGHSHPKVVEAVKKQAEDLIHPGFNVMMYPSYIELAEKLCALAPGDHAKKAIFLNSGAEAVENAVKIARKYTKRQAVVSFTRGFHGRTNMTMSMTSKVNPYKFGFGPFASEVYQAPFPYYYQKPAGMSDEQYDDFIISAFEDFFIAAVAPETVACVVMEPVQGEGGFIIPSKRFVQHVAAFCKKHGIVFVADEIQTGFARTGTYFAIEHFGAVPDLITVSKSLAAGLPLSGVIGRAEMLDAAAPGELGGTYAGSPLGCAAALAVLDIIEEEGLNQRSEEIGRIIEHQAREWKKSMPASEKCADSVRWRPSKLSKIRTRGNRTKQKPRRSLKRRTRTDCCC